MIYIKLFSRGFLFSILLILSISVIGQYPTNSQLKFNVASKYQTGLNTIQTRYADLDGDGFLDISTVNGGQENPNPTITILFGITNGKFTAPTVIPLPSYMVGHTIAVGDLNHDDQPDLVIASFYQNRIAVLLNQGNRQFSAPVFSVPPDPPNPGFPYGEFFDLAIADFDGDGNNDVVALQDQIDQRLRFFHLSGQGTLTVFATLNQLEQNTSYERKMVIGDLNGDSRPDIVFAGGGPFGIRNLSFVFGQSAGGQLSITYGFSVDDRTVGISVNDLDNDGDRDLAVTFLDTSTPTRHSLQVFRNNGSGGFTSTPKIFLDYPFPPDDITTADFNNDGVQDLAALLGSVYDSGVMVMVSYGTNNGTYIGEKYYAVPDSSTIFAADLNQDGKTDILTASSLGLQSFYSEYGGVSNNSVNILFNDNFQRFKAPLVTLWGANFLDSGDFNNDNYIDLVSSWASSFNATSSIEMLINDTNEGLLPETSHPSTFSLTGMKTGDFNGDGKWDVISIHGTDGTSLAIYLGNGTGELNPPVYAQFGVNLKNVIVRDFNSDGKDDVFATDSVDRGIVLLGTDGGTFSVAPGSPISMPGSGAIEPQSGDFNGDLHLDLIVSQSPNMKLWLGDGTGRFTPAPATMPVMNRFVSGDFNGDGKLDLAGMLGNSIIGVLGDGSGNFNNSYSRQIRNFSHNTTQSIVSADFDMDGYDDVAIIMADNTFGSLIVIPSGGTTNSWKEPIFCGVGAATRMLVAKDFNADGKPDIGWLGDNSRGVVYNVTDAPRRTSFDFDADGKADIATFRPENGTWYLQQSTAGFAGSAFGLSTDKLVPADYDGDGKTDVAVYRSGIWYLQRSATGFTGISFGDANDIPIPADYDGDGRAELAVFRPSNGYWYILNLTTNQFTATLFGISTDKPVPADYDGDGKSDIAVNRSGNWYIQRSQLGFTGILFGDGNDKLVPADYDGDGKVDVAVFRPSNGYWYLLQSQIGFTGIAFGLGTDIPVAEDYDGDRKADLAVVREGNWYIQRSAQGFSGTLFGASTDLPIPNSFVR